MTTFRWRALVAADLPALAGIAEAAFPDHYEDPVHFAERLALSPAWCFGLQESEGGLSGYLIAYLWPLGTVPPLNTPLDRRRVAGSSLFLHDLALTPEASGRGLAQAVVHQLAQAARAEGLDSIALVSVNGSERFWRRQGFSPVEPDPELAAKLARYGEDARYMVRRLSGPAPPSPRSS